MLRWRIPLGEILLTIGLALAGNLIAGQPGVPAPDRDLQEVRELLAVPESDVDLTKSKLAIDRLIDPTTDIAGTQRQLDAMAAQVRKMFPSNASKSDTVLAMQKYLYVSGPWNGQHPFHYDLDDPYGKDIRTKLLSTYLSTRKGNCVSMPLLFIILGQKLGLDVTAAQAPEHVFVKFRDEHGQYYNIEATSGGFKSDESYRKDLPMTDEALANGIYLRALSHQETVLVMAETLLEFYGQHGQQERRIALANLMLSVNPKDVFAMLQEGNAYYRLMQVHFINKYPVAADIPMLERPNFLEMQRNNLLWFNRAEALGWRQPTQVQEDDYKSRIERAKATAH